MISFLSQHAGVIGLLIFFGFFIGMLLMLLRPGAKEKYRAYGKIPFKDETHE